MDLNSLNILNPWWKNRQAIDQDPHITEIKDKPYYFNNPIKKELKLLPQQTYIVRGPRQVGKTTLLKEKIREAIYDHVPSTNCLYLSCEAIASFGELQELLTKWLGSRQKEKILLCLDEVTFVPEWQRSLLWLINAGLLKNTTTLITGSNARDLKISAERFPGRHVCEIKFHPISYLDYKNIPCFKDQSKEEMLEIYYKVGGFPHAIRDYFEKGYVTDDTFETYANWIFGDAHRFNLSRELLTHILFRIFDTLGSQVTWQRLVEKSPVKSHETASAYVEHLDLSFLCNILNCYDPQKEMSAPRKAKKIYFVDPILYGVAGGYLRGTRNIFQWWQEQLKQDQLKGNIFESIVVNQLSTKHDHLYYWYSSNLKREVDILIKNPQDFELYEVKLKTVSVKPVLGKNVSVITPKDFIQNGMKIKDESR